jgi:hypothetical protein
MTAQEIAPTVDPARLLPGAQFVDAYRIVVEGNALDAREAAIRMTSRTPHWIDALLRLRNLIVTPFGLKTPSEREPPRGDVVGFFPVLSETPERLIMGLDDAHLDFRAVVEVAAVDAGQQVTLTTLVLTHNWLGRNYLRLILPFHRAIARNMLQRIAGRSDATGR